MIHLDLTQLLLDPRRTGIQRAERELIRHWPGPAPLVPCRFDGATRTLHELPASLLAALGEDSPPGGVAAERARLAPHMRLGPVARPDRLLCAELFYDADRSRFYRARPAARTFWLVYDFLPWLDPGWFFSGAPAQLMPYIHALQAVDQVAFISAATRRDYVQRIARRACDGPVIPMGGDGLGLERQSFTPARRRFVVLGTVEPRKNPAAAMRAVRQLWEDGIDAELLLIGAAAPDAPDELALLAELSSDPRFRHRAGLNDQEVRDELRGARAMLFPSEGEGYGIPPMEALHAGIPAIVSARLPALEDAPALGQLRLPTISPDTVAAAMRTLLDDTEAERLWSEAARMTVPTWADFSRDVARWVQA